jgi:hypothetical protein
MFLCEPNFKIKEEEEDDEDGWFEYVFDFSTLEIFSDLLSQSLGQYEV